MNFIILNVFKHHYHQGWGRLARQFWSAFDWVLFRIWVFFFSDVWADFRDFNEKRVCRLSLSFFSPNLISLFPVKFYYRNLFEFFAFVFFSSSFSLDFLANVQQFSQFYKIWLANFTNISTDKMETKRDQFR